MIPQPDLFAVRPSAPPPRPVPPAEVTDAAALPPRLIAWERMVARASCQAVSVIASTIGTGLVLESLCAPELPNQPILRADGTIGELLPDHGRQGRFVYCTPTEAAKIHARKPLLPIEPGTPVYQMLRFARPGEDADATPAILAAMRGREP